MKASIITIGDEILIGQIVDTNSVWIASHLNDYGIRVDNRLSVGDDSQAITEALNEAMNTCQIVIVTGGLGPTKDDITKTTLAGIFGGGMREDRRVYEMVEKMLATRRIDFNKLNREQAMVPECCTVLLNHNGTAPGMWFERGGSVLVSLPGVPFEMKVLMEQEVLPRLKSHFSLSAIVHKTMATIGIAESVLAATIESWEDSLPHYLHLAYLPGTSGIRLRLSAYEVDEKDAGREIDARFAELEKMIAPYFLGYGDTTVETAVAKILTTNGRTLAVAESCTGGEIASRFTAHAGASGYFLCGVVSYSNQAKTDVLGVNHEDIMRYGAVSKQVAEQMALGVKRIAGADYAIATTGIAGPDGGSQEKPVGTVWIAVAHPEGVYSRRMMFGLLREQNIERASASAINILRLILTGNTEILLNEGVL